MGNATGGNKSSFLKNANIEIAIDLDNEGRDINAKGEVIHFNTKHERIIHKLKNLRKRANVVQESEVTNDIDW